MLGAGQERKLVIHPETEEGKLLNRAGEAKDESVKLSLLDEFLHKYPDDAAVPWVCAQAQNILIKQGQFERSLETGQIGLRVAPRDLDISYNNLRAAEEKKDFELVKKWAVTTSQIAQDLLAEETAQAAHAQQIEMYAEYSLYALAVRDAEPGRTIDVAETLAERNLTSPYYCKLLRFYSAALRQNGQYDKAGTQAETLAAKNPTCQDALLLAADYNLQKRNQPEKVIQYSGQLVNLARSKPDPDGAVIGLANWMLGITYSGQGRFTDADGALRAALPDLKDAQIKASALYYLGLANLQLGRGGKNTARLEDAARFSEQAAAITSPLQGQAQKQARAARAELNRSGDSRPVR